MPVRVLICDDEPALRELMRIALVGDYEFAEAGSVAEAIAAADDFRPDVALIDVMMPGGSGLDVVQHLGGRARCVVVSAFATDEDRQQAETAGAVAFVSKPFDPDELSRKVAELVTLT